MNARSASALQSFSSTHRMYRHCPEFPLLLPPGHAPRTRRRCLIRPFPSSEGRWRQLQGVRVAVKARHGAAFADRVGGGGGGTEGPEGVVDANIGEDGGGLGRQRDGLAKGRRGALVEEPRRIDRPRVSRGARWSWPLRRRRAGECDGKRGDDADSRVVETRNAA